MNAHNYSNVLLVVIATINLLASLIMVVVARQNCPNQCGNVTIPYPFGIGKGCYYADTLGNNSYFEIECDDHKAGPPYSCGNKLIDINISAGELRIANFVSHACYSKNGTAIESQQFYTDLRNDRFTISTTKNVFGAIGCDTYAYLEGVVQEKSYHTGCLTWCDNKQDVDNTTCSGMGCCEISIPSEVANITIQANSFDNHTNVGDFNLCGSAFIVEKNALNFKGLDNLTTVPPETLPVVMDWMIGTENCMVARAKKNLLCKGNSTCDDKSVKHGYRCKCLPGYAGNPYLTPGCKDVDECSDERTNQCVKPGYCSNTNGSYLCKCPKGFIGNGIKSNPCVRIKIAYEIFFGIGGGIVSSLALASYLYCQREKRKIKKARMKFFNQNGGNLLRQKLNGRDDIKVEVVKLFTVEELEKATNKYSHSNIIGKGGFGTVYRGILPNKQVVAIKRSLKVSSSQSEQFINEVIVLSQLNNRNVVKLLGCCLETEVPLLVYEYIDNGTLHEHLEDEEKATCLTWKIRLKIALEVAEVLSYLHTTISIPIIHRDMKSMNILLDKCYSAKVSDFGASRLVPLDQENLATIVLGTYGYLDPEYLQTGELTQKSDVYSFGVVLVELLTRQRALSKDREDMEKCLAIFFLRKLREERLHDILDGRIVRDESIGQIMQVAELARWCLQIKGDDRPSMKEVANELQRIGGMMKGPHPWYERDTVIQEENAQLLTRIVSDDRGIDASNSALASLGYGR